MHEVEQSLAGAVVKHLPQEFELVVRVAQSVAVGKEKHLAVDFGG